MVARRRTYSTLQSTPSGSEQGLWLHAIAVENVLVPGLGSIRAIGSRNDKRPLLDQNDCSCRMGGAAVQPCDVAGDNRGQRGAVIPRKGCREISVGRPCRAGAAAE